MRFAHTCLACLIAIAVPVALSSQATSNGLPSVSPDGRRIAFVGTRDGRDRLFVIEADGTNEREVAIPGVDGRAARWSRNGELLFGGAGADSGKVFAVSVEGGTAHVVASVPGRSPTLSPDGSQVLYLTGPWTSTALAVADKQGSHVRILAGGRATAWNGAWSPDGMHVAYTYGDSSRVLQVHVVNFGGGGDRAVTHTTRDQGSAQMPAWSPDGSRLAIQVNNPAAHSSEIWVVDVSSGASHSLSGGGHSYLDETPSWFPDGTRLVFQSNRSGRMEVWGMSADGSNARQLTGRSGS
jgi:Tol biopolymer transport system component